MAFLQNVFLVALLGAWLAVSFPSQPANPILAVVTTPLVDCLAFATSPPGLNPTSCVESYYLRWLEASAVRIVPLPWNATSEQRLSILQGVNGVLFPGGSLGGLAFDEYVSNSTEVFNYAVQRNLQGDPFFLWGTCQGFQVLAVIAAKNTSILKCGYHGTDPSMLPLKFTSYQPDSKLFGSSTPSDILSILMTKNSTLNYHSCGVSPADFAANTLLTETFTTISTNVDINGLPFVSSYESPKYNFFAVQFHAERILYEFSNDIIGHSESDVKVSLYLSNFIAQWLKKNNHSFPNPAAVDGMLLENYPIQNLGYGSLVYWIS